MLLQPFPRIGNAKFIAQQGNLFTRRRQRSGKFLVRERTAPVFPGD